MEGEAIREAFRLALRWTRENAPDFTWQDVVNQIEVGRASLDSLITDRDRAMKERDDWRRLFQSKQVYPISEMEQKLAKAEVENKRLRSALEQIAMPYKDDPPGGGQRASIARAALSGETDR